MTSSENLKNAIAEHQTMFAKLGDLIPQISITLFPYTTLFRSRKSVV